MLNEQQRVNRGSRRGGRRVNFGHRRGRRCRRGRDSVFGSHTRLHEGGGESRPGVGTDDAVVVDPSGHLNLTDHRFGDSVKLSGHRDRIPHLTELLLQLRHLLTPSSLGQEPVPLRLGLGSLHHRGLRGRGGGFDHRRFRGRRGRDRSRREHRLDGGRGRGGLGDAGRGVANRRGVNPDDPDTTNKRHAEQEKNRQGRNPLAVFVEPGHLGSSEHERGLRMVETLHATSLPCANHNEKTIMDYK